MLRSKFLFTLCIVAVILALVSNQQVMARPEPEPCREFMRMMRPPPQKPTSAPTPEPPKDPKKAKLKKFEQLLERLNPRWSVHIEEATTPAPPVTAAPNVMDTYMAFFGYLFSML